MNVLKGGACGMKIKKIKKPVKKLGTKKERENMKKPLRKLNKLVR